MQNVERKLFPFPLSITIWLTAGVLLGSAFALTGLAGIFVSAAAALLIVFAACAAKFPTSVMGVSIWCLALVPFSWGLQTGVIPKLFGDESLLLLYMAVFPFLYLFTKRSWQHGLAGLYALLVLLLFTQSLSFVAGTDLVAIRNFTETLVLGGLLLVLFLQEASNINPDAIGKFIVGVTVVIAILSILERISLRNPIMEGEVNYLSPELARITEGVYRPYVSFFHPSETGTFMALGVPFTVRAWTQRKSWLSLSGLLIVAAGLVANATRGVWVAVLFAALIELRYLLPLLFATVPLAALGGWIGYLAFKSTPFVQRLTNPLDLYARFEYWKIAGKIFVEHPLIGVGHMQFKQLYLDYVQDLSNSVNFDIAQVFVADNMFLTTAVEHGFLGLVALVGLLVYVSALLRRFRKTLYRLGLNSQATFVRCSEMALIIYVVTGCFADVHVFTKATKYIFILIALGLAEGVRYASPSGNTTASKCTVDQALQVHQA